VKIWHNNVRMEEAEVEADLRAKGCDDAAVFAYLSTAELADFSRERAPKGSRDPKYKGGRFTPRPSNPLPPHDPTASEMMMDMDPSGANPGLRGVVADRLEDLNRPDSNVLRSGAPAIIFGGHAFTPTHGPQSIVVQPPTYSFADQLAPGNVTPWRVFLTSHGRTIGVQIPHVGISGALYDALSKINAFRLASQSTTATNLHLSLSDRETDALADAFRTYKARVRKNMPEVYEPTMRDYAADDLGLPKASDEIKRRLKTGLAAISSNRYSRNELERRGWLRVPDLFYRAHITQTPGWHVYPGALDHVMVAPHLPSLIQGREDTYASQPLPANQDGTPAHLMPFTYGVGNLRVQLNGRRMDYTHAPGHSHTIGYAYYNPSALTSDRQAIVCEHPDHPNIIGQPAWPNNLGPPPPWWHTLGQRSPT
jgi:hypothetical protein